MSAIALAKLACANSAASQKTSKSNLLSLLCWLAGLQLAKRDNVFLRFAIKPIDGL